MNEQMTASPPAPPPPPLGLPKGMAIASMVLGIVSIPVFCVWWLSIPCGIVAIILGVIAGGKAKRGEAGGAGMAKAGLIMGSIGIVLAVLLVILVVAGITILGPQIQEEMERQQEMQDSPPSGMGDYTGGALALVHDHAQLCLTYARASLGC